MTSTIQDPITLLNVYPKAAKDCAVGFAQVREDPRQDLEAIQAYFPEDQVDMLMIASGGDTAAYLLAEAPLNRLHIIDPNPAQIALTKLKIHLLSLPIEKRLQILGHRPLANRKQVLVSLFSLLDLEPEVLGPIDFVAEKGPDFFGRYERVSEELRKELGPYQQEFAKLFFLDDIEEQSRRIAPETPLGQALDQAFALVFSQENLSEIFGEKATANRAQEFSNHFASKTREYLSRANAADSPYLATMFLGEFFEDTRAPWLQEEKKAPAVQVTYANQSMIEALQQAEKETYHVIHLSNILDWLSPAEAQETLTLASRALKPGGVIIVRQLNSNLDIPSLDSAFHWERAKGAEMNGQDRSFFYRNFFLATKPIASPAPKVQEMADQVLQEISVMASPYFRRLSEGTMTLKEFQKSQREFFYAVDFFSRPMAALISRMPKHVQRRDILHNIVEEHGDFSREAYHSTTFLLFLERMGVDVSDLPNLREKEITHAFNTALMGTALSDDLLTAVTCIGIIEYAFADVSALIGKEVVAQGWIEKQNLVHYSLHAEIDKRHAAEFFAVAEPHMDNSKERECVLAGLRLGAHIFRALYDQLAEH